MKVNRDQTDIIMKVKEVNKNKPEDKPVIEKKNDWFLCNKMFYNFD